MKLLVLVVLCALAGVWADNKAGHLSQGAPSASESPLSAIPAFAAAVMGAVPAGAAASKPVVSDESGGRTTFLLDVKLNEGDGTESEGESASETPSSGSVWSSMFPVFRFGPNPTARHLRRPEPVVLSEEMASATPLDASGAAAEPPKGLFSAICGGIMDAFFGPPVVPVPLPPPVAAPLVTPNGWFNVRPSSFFSSFLGPSPSEAMGSAEENGGGKTTTFTSSTSTSAGPLIFTITSSSSDSPSDDDAEAPTPTPLLAVPPSPGAELEDAGMHRIGGRSRLGKLFNRVMRFLHLRPPREFEASQQTSDDDTDDAAATADDEPKDDDDEQPTDDTDAATETEGDDDEAATANTEEEDDEQAGGSRWRRWRDHHRRHRGRGRWGHWRRHHRACKRDVRSLCPEARDEGFMGAVRCVLAHPNELSSECKEHLRFSREFNCAPDAVKLCPHATSRREVKRCMYAQRDAVSAQCKVAIAAHRQHHHMRDAETDTDIDAAPTPAVPPTPSASPVPSPAVPIVITNDAPAQPKGPVIAIELQTTPNAKPNFEYSGAAKPAPSAAPSASSSSSSSGSDNWFGSRRAALTHALERLPKWALGLIAALAAISLIGVVACAVVTCRRSRAAAREAAAKAPRLVVGAPASSAVQFANVTAAPAPVQPTKSHGAIAVAALAEPLVSVKVAAV